VRRRDFLGLLCGALLTWPRGGSAEQALPVARIGYLSPTAGRTAADQAFEDALRRLGWRKDDNIGIDYRYAAGRQGPTATLAAEAVIEQFNATAR